MHVLSHLILARLLLFNHQGAKDMCQVVPKLCSDELVLEQISVEDAHDVFDFVSSERVAKTVIWDAHATIADSKRSIHSIVKRLSVEEGKLFLCWAVKSRSDHKVIGLITLTELNEVRAQLGYVFHYEHWKQAEPMDALSMVLNYAYAYHLNFQRIQARSFPSNTVARSLLEGLGFQFEGINRAIMKVRGEVVDLTCYATTRTQWSQLRSGKIPYAEMAEHI
jgi:ribosomal-protein-alanine N-acetyltransferase